MTTNTNTLHALITYGNTLPLESIYRKVVETYLTNLEAACTLSIEQMSELCYTSPATLTRLARTLGYKGYSDFRTNLNHAYESYSFYNRLLPDIPEDISTVGACYLQTLISELERFRDSFDASRIPEICDAIHVSERVVLFLGRLQSAVSVCMQADLAMDGRACVRALNVEQQLSLLNTLDEHSFVMIKTGTQNTGPNILGTLLDQIARRKAKLLIIGTGDFFQAKKRCDYFLEYAADSTLFDSFLVDVVLAELTTVYRTKFIDRTQE